MIKYCYKQTITYTYIPISKLNHSFWILEKLTAISNFFCRMYFSINHPTKQKLMIQYQKKKTMRFIDLVVSALHCILIKDSPYFLLQFVKISAIPSMFAL